MLLTNQSEREHSYNDKHSFIDDTGAIPQLMPVRRNELTNQQLQTAIVYSGCALPLEWMRVGRAGRCP